jgi:hypothetical protein
VIIASKFCPFKSNDKRKGRAKKYFFVTGFVFRVKLHPIVLREPTAKQSRTQRQRQKNKVQFCWPPCGNDLPKDIKKIQI